MSKKSSFTPTQRVQIVVLHNEDCSEQEINRKIDCSKTAVHIAIPNFQNSGIFNDKERSGRLRKTSAKDDHLMKHSATRSITSSYKRYMPLRFRMVRISIL